LAFLCASEKKAFYSKSRQYSLKAVKSCAIVPLKPSGFNERKNQLIVFLQPYSATSMRMPSHTNNLLICGYFFVGKEISKKLNQTVHVVIVSTYGNHQTAEV
jgi:hypothetical protein